MSACAVVVAPRCRTRHRWFALSSTYARLVRLWQIQSLIPQCRSQAEKVLKRISLTRVLIACAGLNGSSWRRGATNRRVNKQLATRVRIRAGREFSGFLNQNVRLAKSYLLAAPVRDRHN